MNLEVTLRLSFQGLQMFLGRDKLEKCTQFSTGRCCTHPILIIAAQSLIISLERIKCSIFFVVLSIGIFLFREKFSFNSELFCGSGR